MAIARTHILVCGGTGCSSSHSQALIDELNRELEEKGLLGEVQVIKTGCAPWAPWWWYTPRAAFTAM